MINKNKVYFVNQGFRTFQVNMLCDEANGRLGRLEPISFLFAIYFVENRQVWDMVITREEQDAKNIVQDFNKDIFTNLPTQSDEKDDHFIIRCKKRAKPWAYRRLQVLGLKREHVSNETLFNCVWRTPESEHDYWRSRDYDLVPANVDDPGHYASRCNVLYTEGLANGGSQPRE